MSDEYLKDRTGRVIGRIRDDGTIVDRIGATRGRYDENFNRTTDRSGKFVGTGDLRSMLLPEDQK